MFKIYDGRSEFYQWDLNRKLIVSDPTIDEVHFCNKTDNCSLVVEVYEEDGLRLANVPNVLLHNHWDIKVFGYCGGSYTKQCAKFKVNARSKPADYVYTEVEIKSWEALEEKCNKALEAAEKIEDDLKDYVKNTDYAEVNKYGLVKLGNYASSGFEIKNNGTLGVYYARANDLKNKTSNTVVTAYNIPRAVKEGLIDPENGGIKGEWTDNDKKQAQSTLGFLTGEGVPTATTVGYAGQIYTDTLTGESYKCTSVGLKGEGNPNGVVESDTIYQFYSDTLNQKVYFSSSTTNRTQWNIVSNIPYADTLYSWHYIFTSTYFTNYGGSSGLYDKSIRVNNIKGNGGGAAEEIDLGATDRTIDFRLGGNFGLRMEALAATGIDYTAFKPYPGINNTRKGKTDLGTAEYPFRKLHLNDGVYVNGKSIVYTAPIEKGDDLNGKTIKFDTNQDINKIIETYPIGSSFFETDTYGVQRINDAIYAFDFATGGIIEQGGFWCLIGDVNGWQLSELTLGGTVTSVYNGGCPEFISKDVDCEHNYNEIAKLKAEIERLSSLLESKS